MVPLVANAGKSGSLGMEFATQALSTTGNTFRTESNDLGEVIRPLGNLNAVSGSAWYPMVSSASIQGTRTDSLP